MSLLCSQSDFSTEFYQVMAPALSNSFSLATANANLTFASRISHS